VVPAAGGREAAIVAVEVAVRDRARFAEQAAAADAVQPDGTVSIAGTRILPV
jgi:hypothetical protein